MKPTVIVWDLETVPDLGGFAAANDLVGVFTDFSQRMPVDRDLSVHDLKEKRPRQP